MGRLLEAGIRMHLRQAMWQGQISRDDFRAMTGRADIMADLHDQVADQMAFDGVDSSDSANLSVSGATTPPGTPTGTPATPAHPILAWLASHLTWLLTIAMEIAKAFGLNITIPTLPSPSTS